MNKAVVCRGCGAQALEPVIDFGEQPVAHRMLKSQDESEPRFPFALWVCTNCALVQVPEPISPEELYRGFNFNFSSWKAEPHIEDELSWIFEGGTPKSVCEIGANDGRFLAMLRDRGAETLVGVEPNPVPAEKAREQGFSIYGEFLDSALAEQIVAEQGVFDLIIFRQVFEHIGPVQDFLEGVRALLAPEGRVFIDLPDFDTSCDVGDGTTLWEEHVNYFNEKTLGRTLGHAGLEIQEVRRYNFSGGCLAVIAGRSQSEKAAAPADSHEVVLSRAYGEKIERYRGRLNGTLAKLRDAGWSIAMYGAGVRAAAASNFLQIGSLVDVAIDDQVERQGLFLPGSAVPVKGLNQVEEGSAGVVFLLAVNNESEPKVTPKIEAREGRHIVISLCGPADIWAELTRLEDVAASL